MPHREERDLRSHYDDEGRWREPRRMPPSSDSPPDGRDLLGGVRSRRPGPVHSSGRTSDRHSDPQLPDLDSHGYAGQGYPIYGRPSGLDPHPGADRPWLTEPSAYAFGFTPAFPPFDPAASSNYGHDGKGPRDYVRSDARIREDVCDRLSDDDEVDASDISVSVQNGEVLLEGHVRDRQDKRRAEDVAWSVRGVLDVHNELRKEKTFLRELGDKLTGDDAEHHGQYGSGTRNQPVSRGHG